MKESGLLCNVKGYCIGFNFVSVFVGDNAVNFSAGFFGHQSHRISVACERTFPEALLTGVTTVPLVLKPRALNGYRCACNFVNVNKDVLRLLSDFKFISFRNIIIERNGVGFNFVAVFVGDNAVNFSAGFLGY